MPNFVFRAINSDGEITRGTRSAQDIFELQQRLRGSNLDLLTAREIQSVKVIKALQAFIFGRVNREALIEFSNNMRVLLAAGVALIEALTELKEEERDTSLKRILANVIEDVRSGMSLHHAMEKWPKCFPPLYVNVIEIGENTGQFDTVFGELVTHYSRIEDLKKNARKAMIYPSFVFATLILVSVIFLGKVFPVIEKMFEEFELKRLPAITEFFLSLSNVIQTHGVSILAGVVACIILVIILRSIKTTRYYFDWLEINLPGIKGFFLQLRMAFFARYLATLQKAGLDILRSMELSTQSINNLVLQKIMYNCSEDIQQGKHLSEALKTRKRIIPNMVIRMIAVGELSGSLPEQLEFVAGYYDEALDRRISIFLALMEPILIVILAGIGLALILAILMPMYEFLGAIFTNY
jgi:type IV pilus assembly protein PilC